MQRLFVMGHTSSWGLMALRVLAERVGDVHTRDADWPDSAASTSWIRLLRLVECFLVMSILEVPSVFRGRSTRAGLAGAACAISQATIYVSTDSSIVSQRRFHTLIGMKGYWQMEHHSGRCGTAGDEDLVRGQLNNTADEYEVLITILARGWKI